MAYLYKSLLKFFFEIHNPVENSYWIYFISTCSSHVINITQVSTVLAPDTHPDRNIVAPLDEVHRIYSNSSAPLYTLMLVTMTAYLSYVVGK